MNDTTLSSVMGGRMNIINGVVYIRVPRRDPFVLSGAPVEESAVPASMIIMDQPTAQGARTLFDVAVLPSEAAGVFDILRNTDGVQITGVNSRRSEMAPEVTYIHGSAIGDSTAVVTAIRKAINKTNSEGSPK